jgi:S-DNA-T family DNA segregation ATPase FtsK/SpoIIIE
MTMIPSRPLLAPARIDLSGIEPASLTSWWLGWAEDSRPVMVRLVEVSGMVVAGLAGFGKTMLVANLRAQLAPSPAIQFVLVDGKGGPDHDRLIPRAWLSAKDDLDQVRDVLRRVHRLMVDRQASIAHVLGVTDAWHLGPSPAWPLVVVVIDEAHSFFHERKATSPEVKAHNALVAEVARLVEELVRKGPQRRHPGHAAHPAGHRGCHPDPHPRQLPGRHRLRYPHRGRGRGRPGGGDPPVPGRLPGPAQRPAYVGVAVTSLPGRPGFHRVRTPKVDHHQVAAIIRATSGLRRDPAGLLAEQAPGLRVAPKMPTPGDAA